MNLLLLDCGENKLRLFHLLFLRERCIFTNRFKFWFMGLKQILKLGLLLICQPQSLNQTIHALSWPTMMCNFWVQGLQAQSVPVVAGVAVGDSILSKSELSGSGACGNN